MMATPAPVPASQQHYIASLDICRSGYEEENIYAKVDDMTYYPVISAQPHPPPALADQGSLTLTKQRNIINNMMVTQGQGDQSKTLNLHQANLQKQKDFNTFNAFSTVHRSQKIYL